jgi:Resolvase, N terminal domain.
MIIIGNKSVSLHHKTGKNASFTTNKLKTNMAKVGYIFLAEAYESVESDKAWMEKFGCVKIVEENAEDEKLRPEWKALLMSLERGDELVLSKFSNALRGTRELSYFLELCRIKVIRIISIHDKVDSKDEVFPALKTSDFLDMIGSLPAEVATLRKASTHIMRLRTAKTKTKSTKSRTGTRGYDCKHVQWRPCY